MLAVAGMVLWALVAQAAPKSEPTEVEAELRRARNEYAYGNHEKAAELLRGLLYPMRLYNDDQVIETRKYLALSYYLLGKINAASEEFGKLLYLSPDYQLDPYTVPPPIIELFELVREKMRLELDALRQLKTDEQLKAETQRGFVRHVEQTLLERSEIATILPFGVGQFQNGDHGWGLVFAVSELALLAVNVGAYLMAQSYGDFHDRSRERQVQALTVTQYGALALFGVVWSLGVFQARLRFLPVVPGARVVRDEPLTSRSGMLELRFEY